MNRTDRVLPIPDRSCACHRQHNAGSPIPSIPWFRKGPLWRADVRNALNALVQGWRRDIRNCGCAQSGAEAPCRSCRCTTRSNARWQRASRPKWWRSCASRRSGCAFRCGSISNSAATGAMPSTHGRSCIASRRSPYWQRRRRNPARSSLQSTMCPSPRSRTCRSPHTSASTAIFNRRMD